MEAFAQTPSRARTNGPVLRALQTRARELTRAGKYADAIPLVQRALAQSRYTDAEPLYRRSPAIREEVLGPDHPDVAPALNKPGGTARQIRMDQLTLMSRPEAYLQDLQIMERCLEVAQLGAKKGELPFGALIVSRGQVIAEATNRVSSESDVTRHAELVALSEAQKILKRKRLQDCTLYSIVEPCPMCSFFSREARVGRVVFALSSPVMGGYSKWDVLKDDDLSNKLPEVFGPPPEIVSGLLAAQAEQVWSQWHPLAWRFMKRRGCFGSAADLPERHAAAPRPMFSWAALTAFLAAPVLSVSKAFLRSRAGSKAMPKFDPESDS